MRLLPMVSGFCWWSFVLSSFVFWMVSGCNLKLLLFGTFSLILFGKKVLSSVQPSWMYKAGFYCLTYWPDRFWAGSQTPGSVFWVWPLGYDYWVLGSSHNEFHSQLFAARRFYSGWVYYCPRFGRGIYRPAWVSSPHFLRICLPDPGLDITLRVWCMITGSADGPGLLFCSVSYSFVPSFGWVLYLSHAAAQCVCKLKGPRLLTVMDHFVCKGLLASSGLNRPKIPPQIYRINGYKWAQIWMQVEGPYRVGCVVYGFCYVVHCTFCKFWARVHSVGGIDIIPTIMFNSSRCSMFPVFVVITKGCFGDRWLDSRGYAP
ncbi:hypothetical protein Hanom_Chr15g01337171 [Helianthus anomalus]